MPQFEQPPVRWRLAMEHFFIAKKEEPHRTDYAPVMVDAQVSDQSAADASDAGKAAGDALRQASQKPRPGAHSSKASAQLELESASDQAPASADPGLAYVLSIRRAESAWFFPIRAKSVRRSPVRCANTVAGQASRNVFSFITGISLRRCGLMPKR